MTSGGTRANRLDPAVLTAAIWAVVVHIDVRRQLRTRPIHQLRVISPPRLPPRARAGVLGALRRTHATCLTRSAVLQRWDAAHGSRRDLVIGVTSPSEGFRAHAWLDGDPPCHEEGYQELLRHPVSERLTSR